ncbi:hypothetical protein [Colwellia sp. Arc7-D]|jgi:hypothetical protein|uniref:hypothetical protein n=1 Tax=Colwellia sp. Arc7-D TaxID=2161872 RepID=UPI000D353633|nr:hypothetical protein [Colwellia sp. Arc7-D]AWB58180.1 hypothetical protein DBO93_11780 [Colwellia sp. Arc7-D]|tara:strand:+ start:1172 stop:1417 length:246 start_codon:yes stop_codon:yes gene_type:complete
MNNIEQNLTEALQCEDDISFVTSDEELFKRAESSANVQQGSKDLISLGMASIWVVFAGLFINVLKPTLNNKADTRGKSNGH